MAGKSLGQRARLLFLLRLKFLKEGHKGVRIITRLVHVLQAKIISFSFKAARELHEGERQPNADRLAGCIADAAPNEDQWEGRNIENLSFRSSSSRVTSCNVGDLMGHHAG